MAAIASLALAVALLAPWSAGRSQIIGGKPLPGSNAAEIEVSARPIANFDRSGGTARTFGRLEFRGGLVLTSPSNDFGGWSGLVMDPDGRHFIMISDAGSWMTGEIAYDGGKPAEIRKARLGPLRAQGGGPLARSRDRDAEEITLLDGTLTNGTALIAFEHNHRIGRFPLGPNGPLPPTGYLKRAPEWSKLRPNLGIEAMTVLRGGPLAGGVLAFAERLPDAQGNHTGWLWPKGSGGDPQRLGLTNIGDYSPTGAASLPDGSVILLERYFTWTQGVKMRMRLLAAGDIRPGATLRGEVLLEADMTFEIDNMEGIGLHRGPGGETVITLVSDDNFNHFLQRTLLLQFALPPQQKTASPH